MVNDDDDVEGEKLGKSWKFRSRARGWNITIHTLPAFAMNLSWKWRNYLSPHRASTKYEISSVASPSRSKRLIRAAAHEQVTNISSNLECHLIYGIYFHVEKAATTRMIRMKGEFSLTSFNSKLRWKVGRRGSESEHNGIICCVGKYFTIIFYHIISSLRCIIFLVLRRKMRRSNFPHWKELFMLMFHGVENRVWVDAQIISSCHFHRFHYNFPAFITLTRWREGKGLPLDTRVLFRKLFIRQLNSWSKNSFSAIATRQIWKN